MIVKGNNLNKLHITRLLLIFFVMCIYFMETIKEFENLTQLSKFEKQNKGKLKISNIDYNEENKLWNVTFVNLSANVSVLYDVADFQHESPIRSTKV
jgi:hypothetical protein